MADHHVNPEASNLQEQSPAVNPTGHHIRTNKVSSFLSRSICITFADLSAYLVVALFAVIIGLYLQANVLFDDAAIAFRYVERIVHGHGFTYNSHEHVLGISDPLHALILSLLTYAGMNVETAARGLAVVLFSASAVLAMHLTKVLSRSRLAGVLAGILLVADIFFRSQCLSGMESVLSVFLGLLVVLSVSKGRDVAAGIFLGLAVWNKLDAGMLALGLTLAWLLVRRQLPIRTALVSCVVIIPWAVFALFYFGSPIPHSFIAKATERATQDVKFDPWWIGNFFLGGYRFLAVACALTVLGLLRKFRTNEKAAIVTLLGWFFFHFLAFSLINLAAPYPWYLTVLIPPVIILACVSVGRIYTSEIKILPKVLLGGGALVLLLLGAKASTVNSFEDLANGNPIKSWEAFDNDRRLAGIFLSQYADRREIISSAYGWPAFESKMPFNDVSLLNSKIMREPTEYLVVHGVPATTGTRGPDTPGGYIALANFNLASDLFPGYSWFTVFGRPDSSIARMGSRYLQYRLFELPPPKAYDATNGLEHIKIAGVDFQAHPPSGATFTLENAHQPVHVVFTPTLNSTVPPDKSDGVTFEVWSGGTRLYQRHVLPTEHPDPVILSLSTARDLNKIEISFLTTPGPNGDLSYDWAIWKSVKVVVGDAFIDIWRQRNEKIMEAWARYNPVGVSNKMDQLARAQSRPTPSVVSGASLINTVPLTYGGAVDRVNCDALSGWLWTSAQPELAISLELYVDNKLQTKLKADQFRKDLRDAGFGTGNYAFVYPIPLKLKDRKLHALKVKVENSNYEVEFFQDTHKSITCSP